MLEILHIRYEITSDEPLRLHHDVPTITFRGAFGYALAQVIARYAGITRLGDQVELYRRIFMPRNDGSRPLRDEDLSRPFVMRGWFSRPDRRSFILDVLLFGQAAGEERFFDVVMRVMAQMHIGPRHQRCAIEKICSQQLTPDAPEAKDFLRINFLTPCSRLKSQGEVFRSEIPFYALFARLADRVDALNVLYGGGEPVMPRSRLVELKLLAREIPWRTLNGGPFKVTRTSGRTADVIRMDGFVGSMLYAGEFTPFLDYLQYLPFINVGRFNVFGCGWCEMDFMDQEPILKGAV